MTRRREALAAALTAAAALVVAALVLEVWKADLRAPFADTGDAALNLVLIKDTIENAWYFENSHLGAPAGLELYDYPVINGEALSVALFHLLAIGSNDPALVLNLFFLLTFPLAALTSFLVLRRLGAEPLAAGVCSVLYAVLPYHFVRGEFHVFLAAYYAVPVGAYLALAVLGGDDLLRGRRGALATAGLAALVAVASGSFYYSVFTVILVGAAGILRFVAVRDRRSLVAGGVVVAVIGAVSLLQLAPTIAYRAANGRNETVAKRFAFESEVYALKLTDLLLPIDQHRVGVLARGKESYRIHSPPGDARAASLGLVASLGFVWLVAVVLATLAGRRAPGRHPDLGLLTIVSFLFATIGGLGAFVGSIWPETRAWNRLSVFIAFFCLAAVALGLSRLRSRLRTPLYGAVLAAVLVVGILDQTTSTFAPSYDGVARQWRRDDGFFEQLDERLREGAMVVQLPYETFPEPPNAFNGGYEPARAYLHSDDLRWSYAAMRGRDDWAAANAVKPAPELVPAARRAGFAGILLDRAAAAPTAEPELRRAVGAPELASADGRYVFFRL